MDGPNDMDLVREYAASNADEVFTELVRRRINLVYSVALRRLGDPQAAEEVTQAVFIILARKAGSLRPGTVLSGWLYQTAQLTAANYQRSDFRRRRREQEALMQFVQESEPDVSWQRLHPLLEDAMARLGDKERDAVVLRFFENRTVGEVAAELKLSEAAAQKRVNRATEKLRKFFARRGVPVSAGVLAVAIGTNSIHAAPAGLVASVAGAAVLKGSAASISTLTLIQGTLKIMAWTKLKTSIVIGAVALLTAGSGFVAFEAVKYVRVSRYPNLSGAWEGTLDIPSQSAKLRLVLKLVKTNGIYVATMDSIDQSAKDLTVDNIVYDYPAFSLEMKSIGGSYKAKLNAGANEMSGKWNQVIPLPLTLKRTADPDIVPEPLTASDCAPRKDSDLQGIWKTTMKMNNQPYPIELKISEPNAGEFRVEAASVEQGLGRLPASSVVYNRPAVTMEFAGMGATFEGKVDGTDTQMAGALKISGQNHQVTFKRADALAEETHDLEKDYSHNGPDDLPGHWQGTLTIQKVKLRLKVDIAKIPDNKLDCSITSVDQGGVTIPGTAIKFTSPKVHMEWAGIGGAFAGELKNGKLSGKWTQGGMALPLVLERSGGK